MQPYLISKGENCEISVARNFLKNIGNFAKNCRKFRAPLFIAFLCDNFAGFLKNNFEIFYQNFLKKIFS